VCVQEPLEVLCEGTIEICMFRNHERLSVCGNIIFYIECARTMRYMVCSKHDRLCVHDLHVRQFCVCRCRNHKGLHVCRNYEYCVFRNHDRLCLSRNH
jgi:hypothetical protein